MTTCVDYCLFLDYKQQNYIVIILIFSSTGIDNTTTNLGEASIIIYKYTFAKMKIIAILLVYLLIVQLTTEDLANDLCIFDNYVVQYQKKYKDESEYKEREIIFKKNCQVVVEHNREQKAYIMEINQLSDMESEQLVNKASLPQERKSQASSQPDKNLVVQQSSIISKYGAIVSAEKIPNNFHYKFFGSPDTLVDIGTCHADWAFTATRYYEYMIKIKFNNENIVPSTQSTLECTSLFSPRRRVNDCYNGTIYDSLHHLSKVGSVQAQTYPYIAQQYGKRPGHPKTSGLCAEKERIFLGNGTASLDYNLSNDQLKTKLMKEGPLVVGMKLHPNIINYSNGTFDECSPNITLSELNYHMTLIGFQNNSWILDANWGTKFGQNGIMKISLDNDCGIGQFVGNIIFDTISSDVRVTFDPTELYEPEPQSSHNTESKISLLAVTLLLLFFLF